MESRPAAEDPAFPRSVESNHISTWSYRAGRDHFSAAARRGKGQKTSTAGSIRGGRQCMEALQSTRIATRRSSLFLRELHHQRARRARRCSRSIRRRVIPQVCNRPVIGKFQARPVRRDRRLRPQVLPAKHRRACGYGNRSRRERNALSKRGRGVTGCIETVKRMRKTILPPELTRTGGRSGLVSSGQIACFRRAPLNVSGIANPMGKKLMKRSFRAPIRAYPLEHSWRISC